MNGGRRRLYLRKGRNKNNHINIMEEEKKDQPSGENHSSGNQKPDDQKKPEHPPSDQPSDKPSDK